MFMISISAGTSVLKFGAKKAFKYAKRELGLSKKEAPAEITDASNDSIEKD